MDFKNKRVLVTGGSRGIGYAIAKAFLDAGARVAINGKTPQSVQEAIGKMGGGERLVAAPGDIGTVAGCEQAVKTAVDAFSGLDVLVNSAGIGSGRPIEASDEAMWDAHVDVNLKGTFFCCRAALPSLRESKGNIVNIASGRRSDGVPRDHRLLCVERRGCEHDPGHGDRGRAGRAGQLRLPRLRGYRDEQAQQPAEDDRLCAAETPLPIPSKLRTGFCISRRRRRRFVTGIALSIDGGTTAGH